jgi:hypothetical protein
MYECLEEKCKKQFLFAAKIIAPIKKIDWREGPNIVEVTAGVATKETHQCPYCGSLNIQEAKSTVEDIANVYIYELTTGAQTELDKLLAQGYQIVSRFSKQYHLEKPKPEAKT